MNVAATWARPNVSRTIWQIERAPIGNRFLMDLPAREGALIYPHLTLDELRSHEVLQEFEQPVKYVYFVSSGVASILKVTQDGKSVEVGISGKEGCTGLPLAVGFRTSTCRIVVQIPGTAYRISAERLLEILPKCPQLQNRMQRYSHIMAMQSEQIACCNRLHEVDERLARWLLMSQDRIESDVIPLTQEFTSHMLGTRRASVSVAARVLQQAGLICYSRGSVQIVNRAGLEQASCECYQLMCRHTETWAREAA